MQCGRSKCFKVYVGWGISSVRGRCGGGDGGGSLHDGVCNGEHSLCFSSTESLEGTFREVDVVRAIASRAFISSGNVNSLSVADVSDPDSFAAVRAIVVDRGEQCANESTVGVCLATCTSLAILKVVGSRSTAEGLAASASSAVASLGRGLRGSRRGLWGVDVLAPGGGCRGRRRGGVGGFSWGGLVLSRTRGRGAATAAAAAAASPRLATLAVGSAPLDGSL